MTLDSRMQIPIHSSAKLKVNGPTLHDVGLTPPLAILEPTPLIPHTYVTHEKAKKEHRHTVIILGVIQYMHETICYQFLCISRA